VRGHGQRRRADRGEARLRPLRSATAVLCLAALLAGCGAPHHSLADLVEHQETYDGRTVSTSGTVERFEDASGPYYVLDDGAGNRVALTPASSVAGRTGESVTVTGRFSVDPGEGRRIAVDSVSGSGP